MRIALAVAMALGLGSIGVADPSHAAIRKHTSIAPQSLGPALKEFAESRALQLLYFTDAVRNLHTPGAVGEITVDEALTQILEGTGLTYRYLNDDTVTILPLAEATKSQTSTPEPTAAAERAGTLTEEAQQSAGFWARFRLAQADVRSTATTAEGGAEAGESTNPALEEVVVTAQKRAERLQDVPISISVVSGSSLERSSVLSTTDALRRVPGVDLSEGLQGGGTKLTMRGVTVNQPLVGGSSPIGYYVDSAPFGLVRSGIAPDPNVYDLEQIEVLKGPQGTLYGASALNGVVRVLTKNPDLEEFDLKFRTGYSETEDGGAGYRGDMAVNVPIIEGRLAARASVGKQHAGGWVDSPVKEDINDADTDNIRLKIKAQPTDAFSIGLSVWQSSLHNGAASVGSATSDTTNATIDQSIRTDLSLRTLDLAYDFDGFRIASATSKLTYENRGTLGLGNGATAFFTGIDSNVVSQEVLLSSTGNGPWSWSAGAFYRDGEDRWFQTFAGAFWSDFSDYSESFAVFGELRRQFLDGELEWTLGVRYFKDDVATTMPDSTDRLKDTFDATTPRAVLTWYPSADLTVYASYSQGFRSGVLQNELTIQQFASPADVPSADPDKLSNYEMGMKGMFFDHRLQLETALYFIDWQDVQQVVQFRLPNNINVPLIINGASASGLGIDLGAQLQILDGLRLGLNGSWNDLTADAEVLQAGIPLLVRGDRLSGSAEYVAGASIDYEFPLGTTGFTAAISLSGNYVSELESHSISNNEKLTGVTDDRIIGRLSLTLEAPRHWSAMFFVDDLTDERASATGTAATGFLNPRARPRTIGVQIDYAF